MKLINPSSVMPAFLLLLLVGAALAMPSPNTDDALLRRSSPPPMNPAFISSVLTYVNGIRSKHAAAPLTWDANLAAFALKKANGCKLDETGPYGVNSYNFWYTPVNTVPNFTNKLHDAFDFWTSTTEINAYKAGNIGGAYHFTQTIWKASKRIGCAFSTERCTSNPHQEWWFYCEFDPKGNISPYYPGNVTV